MLEDIKDMFDGFYYHQDANFLFWFLLKKNIDSECHWKLH